MRILRTFLRSIPAIAVAVLAIALTATVNAGRLIADPVDLALSRAAPAPAVYSALVNLPATATTKLSLHVRSVLNEPDAAMNKAAPPLIRSNVDSTMLAMDKAAKMESETRIAGSIDPPTLNGRVIDEGIAARSADTAASKVKEASATDRIGQAANDTCQKFDPPFASSLAALGDTGDLGISVAKRDGNTAQGAGEMVYPDGQWANWNSWLLRHTYGDIITFVGTATY